MDSFFLLSGLAYPFISLILRLLPNIYNEKLSKLLALMVTLK